MQGIKGSGWLRFQYALYSAWRGTRHLLPLSSTQAVDQLKVDSNPYRFLLLQIDPALAQYPTPRLRAHQFTAAWPRPFLTAHPGVHEGTSPIRVRAACPPSSLLLVFTHPFWFLLQSFTPDTWYALLPSLTLPWLACPPPQPLLAAHPLLLSRQTSFCRRITNGRTHPQILLSRLIALALSQSLLQVEMLRKPRSLRFHYALPEN